MEEQKPISPVMKGVIISLLLIVLSMTAYFTGQETASWNRWLGNIIIFAGILWACISYGKQLNNNVTFGNVFAHGFKVSAIVTIFLILFSIIFFLLLPEVKEKALEAARAEMEKGGKMSEEQIEQAVAMANKFFFVFTIGGLMFIYMIIGTIASLIGAAVTKKDPRPPFENQS
jgi:drug/metabolite transporter (DMT)-like permease